MILVKLSDYNLAFQIAFVLLVIGVIAAYVYERKTQKAEFQKAKKLFLFFVMVQLIVVLSGNVYFWIQGQQFSMEDEIKHRQLWRKEHHLFNMHTDWKSETYYLGWKPFHLLGQPTGRGYCIWKNQQGLPQKKVAFSSDQWEETDYMYSTGNSDIDSIFERTVGTEEAIKLIVKQQGAVVSEKLLSPPEMNDWHDEYLQKK
jgi:hypothetical protein